MNMKTIQRACLGVLFTIPTTLASAQALVTPNEASLPQANESLGTRGIARGPGIKVVSPGANAVVSGAFEIKVNFEPRGGVKIDPESVKVTYLKSPAIDVTPRMKSSITETGINLKKTELPPGEHVFRITVKDIDGRESASTLTIAKQK